MVNYEENSRPRNNIRLVKVRNRPLEDRARNLSVHCLRSQDLQPGQGHICRCWLCNVIPHKYWRDLPHAVAHLEDVIIWQWGANDFRKGAVIPGVNI